MAIIKTLLVQQIDTYRHVMRFTVSFYRCVAVSKQRLPHDKHGLWPRIAIAGPHGNHS